MSRINRKSQRIDITLAATVLSASAKERCTVRNFCQGGLFIDYMHAQSDKGHWRPRRGERVQVVMEIPSENGTAHFSLDARVAHLNRAGFGVSFSESELGVWYALMRARKQALYAEERPEGGSVKLSAALLEKLQHMMWEALYGHSAPYVNRLVEVLENAASEARNHHDRSDYLTAQRLFASQGRAVVRSWLERVHQRLGALRAERRRKPWDLFNRAAKSDPFQLVGKERFDDWVLIAGLASEMDSCLGSSLLELEERLSAVTGRLIRHELNPMGPHGLLAAFEAVIERFSLATLPKRLVYEILEKEMLKALGPLYESVNDYLFQQGVLIAEELAEETVANTAGAINDKESGSSDSAAEAVANKDGVPPADTGQHDAGRALPQRRQEQTGDGVPSPAAGASVAQTQEEAVKEQPDDDLLERIRRLHEPLTHAARHDPEALDADERSVAALLHELERLARALTGHDPDRAAVRKLHARVQGIVDGLSEEQQRTPEAFARAQQAVAPLLAEYQRMFDAGAARLAEKRVGADRQAAARSRVKQLIAQRFGNEGVAKVILEFIGHGWDELLVRTWLREGEQGRNFQVLLTVLDRLRDWFHPDAAFPPASVTVLQGVLDAIRKGYAAIPRAATEQAQLVKFLEMALMHDAQIFNQLRHGRFGPKGALQMLMPGVPIRGPLDDFQRVAYDRWQDAIEALAVGDWMVQRLPDGQTRPLTLTYIGERRDIFLLVDGKGVKALECNQYELAERLEKINLLMLEDRGLPLVRRAVQKVLKRTYEGVLEQARSDRLTSLMNRSTFSQTLARAVDRLSDETACHVLLLIDLDNFKRVNELCGYEGGDRLLVTIAGLLQTYLEPGAELARVGDDEFAILLPDCSREAGAEIAETQRRAVENYLFNWQGRRLPVSASIGLVAAHAGDDASALLRDADLAVSLAKQAGRNRIRFYGEGDKQTQRYEENHAALALVEEAIRHERLQLYLQRIRASDPTRRDQHEVLLRLTDRQGRIVEPRTFIDAAVQYDRVRVLDRWVIQHFFGWLEMQRGRLQEVGAFCLNLSAQSLLDGAIQDLIADKLEECDLGPGRILFEIQESAFASDFERVRRAIRRLQPFGCEFRLDNFGEGAASFSALRDAPVSSVKIAGRLLPAANGDDDPALVHSIAGICRFQHKEVVIGRVEDPALLLKLAGVEADYLQGYAVGLPFPLERMFAQLHPGLRLANG